MIIYYVAINNESSFPEIKSLDVIKTENIFYLKNKKDAAKLGTNSLVLEENIYIDQSKRVIYLLSIDDAIIFKDSWNMLYLQFKEKYISKFLNSQDSLYLNKRTFTSEKRKLKNYCIKESFDSLLKERNLI